MNVVLFLCTFVLYFSSFVIGQKTDVDNPTNIKLYRTIKEFAIKVLGRADNEGTEYHQEGRDKGTVQRRVFNDVQFPCNITVGRSKNVPKSVHELRPGDIDVIAAMGDSLTAGAGIFASNSLLEMAVENRGVTALGGGQATWREYLTIPNIIKAFNPNLIGYSPYASLTHQRASGFNVAELGAMSRDLPFMSENLIQRIKNHPNVDFKNSWKLISILIGPNDFCSDMCWRKSGPWSILKNHKNELIETLRIFKKNLPRAMISLIPPPNLMILTNLPGKPRLCNITTTIFCSCFAGLPWLSRRDEFSKIITAWQSIDEEVASYPEFHTQEFTVVVQPFATNLTYPMEPDGSTDWRYLSIDCFHLSQIGNARASSAIWKNMLEPVGQKSRDWYDDDTISCPTNSQPYISTAINSRKKRNL